MPELPGEVGCPVAEASGRSMVISMGRTRAHQWMGVVGIPVALLLSGCTAPAEAVTPPTAAASDSSAASDDGRASELSEFEKQLPLSGAFVSQATATDGTVEIERRSDGSVWVVLEGFSTGDASDLRLYLKEDALVQDADGYWGSAEGGYEIAVIDPDASSQEIAVPGAWDMPAISSLTVMDYAGPGFPALGSAALD
jgi:hypothetical protein